MTAAQRYAADMGHRQRTGQNVENPVDLTSEDPANEHRANEEPKCGSALGVRSN